MATWRAMETLVDEGLVRHIGTSNVTIPKLRQIVRDARIRPAVNEMELHPTFQQGELFQFCLDHDIQPMGFSPLGSPSRPLRDRTEDDLVDGEMPDGSADRRGAWRAPGGRLPEVGGRPRAGPDPVLGQAAAVPVQPAGGDRRPADARRRSRPCAGPSGTTG